MSVYTSEFNKLMETLHRTHKEAGGQKIIKNQNAFDALKILIVEKIELTKKNILKREEKNLTPVATAKLNQNIRHMISFVERDLKKLEKVSKNDQKEEVFLISKHVDELKYLDKKRFKKITKGFEQDKDLNVISGDDNDDSSKRRISLLFQDNDEYSLLPPIDISESEKRIKDFKRELDQGIDSFSAKLMQLKTLALETSDEVELQNKYIENINSKVSNETTSLLKMNKRSDEIVEQVSSSTKLCFIFILLAILIIILSIVFIYLSLVL
eukprot:gene326-6740_t